MGKSRIASMKIEYVKKLVCFILLTNVIILGYSQNGSIYSFKVDTITRTKKITFSNFHGKKILIVNAAKLDTNFIQWGEFRQLQERYKDKLVVVIFPFTNVNDENTSTFFKQNSYPFVVASKADVGNNSVNDLYSWLANKSLNELKDSYAKGPYQKYLINEKGKLIGVFGPVIRPMGKEIRNALELPAN